MSRMCCYLSNKFLTKSNHPLSRYLAKQALNASYSKLKFIRSCSIFQKNYAICPTKDLARCTHDESEFDNESFDDTVSGGFFLSSAEKERHNKSFILRNQLYPKSEDPLINLLKECTKEEEVYKALENNSSNLLAEHLSQAVLVLRDLQEDGPIAHPSSPMLHLNPWPRHSMRRFQLTGFRTGPHYSLGNPQFSLLLDKIDDFKYQFDIDALASIVLYLMKLGCPRSHPVAMSLVIQLEQLIQCAQPSKSLLPVLSMYATSLWMHHGAWTPYFLCGFADTKARECIDVCTNFSDLKHLSIFYHKCKPLVTASVNDELHRKFTELIDSIDSSDASNVIRTVTFLYNPKWLSKNSDILNRLLSVFLERDVDLSLKQCLDLIEAFPRIAAPHKLTELLKKVIPDFEHCEESQDKLFVSYLKSVASNYSMQALHNLQVELIQELRSSSVSNESFFYFHTLYRMIRTVSPVNRNINTLYWSKLTRFLEKVSCPESSSFSFVTISYWYLQFNLNNIKFRHFKFEQKMAAWLIQSMNFTVEKYHLSSFTRVAAFCLVYGHFRSTDKALEKLASSISRLRVSDWFVLSKSLYLGLEIRRKQTLSPEFLQQFVKLSALMNEAALEYLRRNPSIQSYELSCLANSLYYRHGVTDSPLFGEIVKRFEDIEIEDFSPTLVKRVLGYFKKMDYFSAKFLETAAEYVIKHSEDLKADVMVILLHTLYLYGHDLKCAELFFPVVCEMINRCKHHLSCLQLLQAACALAYFHHLPPSFTQEIFNVKFLEAVDEEIRLNTVKIFYPKNMRNTFLELNRTVCLDYPEQDVPWFHARYCEELNVLENSRTTSLHEDVQEILVHLVGDAKLFQKNIFSPYNHKIDFQIILDWNGLPIEAKFAKNPATFSRVAVLLLSKGDLALPSKHLKGPMQLKQRHLELMGYRVVTIHPTLWNTMFMAEKSSKTDYLRKQIWQKP